MRELALPDPDLRALAIGEVIVAFTPRASAEPGDEVTLTGAGSRPAAELKRAYRHWADAGPPPGDWSAVVEDVHPAASLDAAEGDARHVLAAVPPGDLLVLRVYGGGGPVLSDTAFAARRASLSAAL